MEVRLFILQKCLFYYHIPLFKNRLVCSLCNTSHSMLSQMCARFCTGHNLAVRKNPECACILGSKESLLIIILWLSKFEQQLERVKKPGSRCFLSTFQSNVSTQQSYFCFLFHHPARGDLSLPFTLCSSRSDSSRAQARQQALGLPTAGVRFVAKLGAPPGDGGTTEPRI